MRLPKFLLVVVSVFFLTSATLHAQAGGKNASDRADSVAVVDVGKLLQNHCSLQRTLAVLKTEQAAFEKKVQTERQRFEAMAAELASYASDTPEYRDLEEQISKAKAELNVKTELHDKHVSQKRASAHHDAYVDIGRSVGEFSDAHGIRIVINYDSSAIRSDDPSAIMNRPEKQIVYQRGFDITNFILRWRRCKACEACVKRAATLHKDGPPFYTGRTQQSQKQSPK